jgi:hypothetical protein
MNFKMILMKAMMAMMKNATGNTSYLKTIDTLIIHRKTIRASPWITENIDIIGYILFTVSSMLCN